MIEDHLTTIKSLKQTTANLNETIANRNETIQNLNEEKTKLGQVNIFHTLQPILARFYALGCLCRS